ncbi:acid phosphatase type 7 isoform X2 [Amyelois transitella]|nr:acid phosphatase type 7 isoform X2 [Amyelois transitella]
MKLLFLFLLVGVSWASYVKMKEVQPEQIHLSFGDATNEIVVTWSTFAQAKSKVLYGVHQTNKVAVGGSTVFVDSGKEKRKQWIHKVTLKDLAHDTKYVYKAGSDSGYSEQFSFKTPPAGEDYPLRIAIYGDMGVNNSMALPFLKRDVSLGLYDFILHVGDFAYDMYEENGRVGDHFMNMIQPLAANLPYMTCPGNHESAYNFSHYSHRFSMPGARSSLFYSFDAGAAHFVSISTEVYYFTQYGLKLISDQYQWLRDDLKRASSPENRRKRPWIIVFGHRPMYCSNSDDIDCSVEYTRVGLYGFYALEPLLKEYGVDIALWAHEHSYERTWPLYDGQMYNGTTHPYTDPG